MNTNHYCYGFWQNFKSWSFLTAIVLSLFVFHQSKAQNYLSAQGNHLIDSQGNEVRLTGVNWFGFETSMLTPHGLWTRDLKSMLQQIKDQGFNSVRIPWCNAMLAPGASINISSYGTDVYTGISPMNAEEATKSSPIEIMDILVEWCQDNDMKIILDNHSRAPDGYLSEDLWYTSAVPESQWISDWVFLANRYKNYDAVVAMDLNNEPHDAATWGNSNPATDWNKAAERCGNAILAVNPNVLIMVEGIEDYNGDVYWWGGNLMGAASYPVTLSNPSKLVYSPHEYGPTVYPQSWFTDPSFPSNMPGIWNQHFGYLYNNNISPLFVGEFGIRDPEGTDEIWFDSFLEYMGNDYSWTFWCWNPNSGDTGGLLDNQWANIVTWKMNKLIPYLAPEIPNGTVSPPQDQLVVSTSNLTFSATAGTQNVDVSANISWSATSSATWLSVSPANGSNNGTLTISTTANSGSTARTGTITVSGSGITRTINVSQSGANSNLYLTVSTNELNFNSSSETETVNISANVSWSASISASWIDVAPASGTNNGSVDISVSANTTSSARTGSVTISGGALSQVIAISQAGDSGLPCSNPTPISISFSHDGAGDFCWVTTDPITYLNSWNTASVEINGIDYTNTWSNSLPARINGNYYIHYSANYAYSHIELMAGYTFAKTSGNEIEQNKLALKIYPNPSQGEFYIDLKTKDNYQLQIVDGQGKQVYMKSMTPESGTSPLHLNLNPGLYIIQIIQRDRIIHSEQIMIAE
ncbi:cellulase family glycosylhydrolase [Fulvivirga ligni]|uniref:cellulase family glycosylhydrolase n=1 Tax=Fulvivirga ligni TaxID=2904246 RepID=UPI001F2BF9DF|nr:cellulase family glycosylhydrolase [Fulvivirga ligni]UII21517.1 cellulase family glycosylhydrolase [Fulvivirga ligni]